MTLRQELIQVAAVAVAIVEDLDNGVGADLERVAEVIDDVVTERAAQNRKWGSQHHSPMEWLAILGEEFGEACQAAVDAHDWSG